MRILVATGGGSHSEAAVRLGAPIAVRTGAELALLTVCPVKADLIQAGRILDRSLALLRNSGASTITRIRVGEAAAEIVAEARSGHYDLVILGERPGRNLLKRIMGSTVERVIAMSPCPVLIARKVVPLQRLLICEGGRQPSLLHRLSARLAPLLAGSQQVVVLHVMSQMAVAPSVAGWELQADAEAHMRWHTPEGELLLQDVKVLQQNHAVPQVKLRHGLVVDEVVAEARDGNYDLLVIGGHREEGLQCYLLDDLAHQIILHTTQPLLVLV